MGPETATTADAVEVVERLTWMLCNPSPFYAWLTTPAPPEEAARLVGAFCRWFFDGSGEPIPVGWRLAWLDPMAFIGFADGFYDTALVAWRGDELRLLFQNGTD